MSNRLLEKRYTNKSPVRILFSLLQTEKKYIVLAILFFIIKSSPVMLFPVFTGKLINIISYPPENFIHQFTVYIIILFIIISQNIPTHILYVKYLSISVRRLEARLRSALVRRLQQLAMSFYKKYPAGKLQSKIIRDVETIQMLYVNGMNILFAGLLNIIFALIYTFYKKPIIVIFYLISIPIAEMIIFLFRSKMKINNKEYRYAIEDMSATVYNMLSMIPITRAFGTENIEITKIDKTLENIKNKGIKLDVLNAFFGSTTWVSFQLFNFLCLIVTGYLAYKKIILIGDVVMYQGFYLMIINSVNSILNIYPQLTKGIESVYSLSEILECPDIEKNEGKKCIKNIVGEYIFSNVSFSYNSEERLKWKKVRTIKNISFTVKPGEKVAIVGKSGAGKSTIINLILGFFRPQKGRILFDGKNINNFDLRCYRRYIAIVPQETILFSGTIKDNITYGMDNIKDSELKKAIKDANADEFINKLPDGINTYIGEQGGKLSGGQRQRIAIARAFLRKAKVIIFDEATSALDPVSEKLILQALKKLSKNRTTFIVSHKLATLKYVDKILVIDNGELVEEGNYKTLVKNKKYFYTLLKSIK